MIHVGRSHENPLFWRPFGETYFLLVSDCVHKNEIFTWNSFEFESIQSKINSWLQVIFMQINDVKSSAWFSKSRPKS